MFGQRHDVNHRCLKLIDSSAETYAATQQFEAEGKQDSRMRSHTMNTYATSLLAGLACALAEMLMPEMITDV